MATRYRFGESQNPHFVTTSVINWVDALSRPLYKDIIIDSLKYCIKNKDLIVHAWVIMNNHIHLVISAKNATPLADIMRDFKKHTAKELLEVIDTPGESRRSWMMWLFSAAGKNNSNNDRYQFWQQDNHPVMLTNGAEMQQKIDYIHDNPVRAGIVYKAEEYKYSSAIDYYTQEQGLLPLEMLI
jgi:REP element-mobilizing transposase RayT